MKSRDCRKACANRIGTPPLLATSHLFFAQSLTVAPVCSIDTAINIDVAKDEDVEELSLFPVLL